MTLLKYIFIFYVAVFFAAATVVSGIAMKFVLFGGEKDSGMQWIAIAMGAVTVQIGILGKIIQARNK